MWLLLWLQPLPSSCVIIHTPFFKMRCFSPTTAFSFLWHISLGILFLWVSPQTYQGSDPVVFYPLPSFTPQHINFGELTWIPQAQKAKHCQTPANTTPAVQTQQQLAGGCEMSLDRKNPHTTWQLFQCLHSQQRVLPDVDVKLLVFQFIVQPLFLILPLCTTEKGLSPASGRPP